MLFLIGTGLCDAKDISARGLEAIQSSERVYIEGYTSLLQCTHEELESELGEKVTRLSREDVESNIEGVLELAKEKNVAILVIGDPFAATTHSDLYLRAHRSGVKVRVVHNASILSAVGAVGLELYRYGRTVSIPYWQEGYEPRSFVDGITQNQNMGMHTLCLLDIKPDKQMTIKEAIELLNRADPKGVIKKKNAVGVARMGCLDQKIISGALSELDKADFGKPPHALIIPGKLHHIEEEMLQLWTQPEEYL